ncbi:MAG: hypothetical protein IJQ93_02465 [Bacteroidales bacterium]|nr:hypothetical protein [Bacteroidales bacterium]
MSGTPIATGRKEPLEAARGPAQRRKKMPLPFQGAAVKERSPRFTDRCGKLTESEGDRSRFGGKERRGVEPLDRFQRSGISSGEKKKERDSPRSDE